jgi:hypothetical protein
MHDVQMTVVFSPVLAFLGSFTHQVRLAHSRLPSSSIQFINATRKQKANS